MIPASIQHLELQPLPLKLCGIYFLCFENEVVYVGQSVDVMARLLWHSAGKEFDEAFFLAVEPADLREIERQWIYRLKPRLNRTWARRAPSSTPPDHGVTDERLVEYARGRAW